MAMIVDAANQFVWGFPALLLILSVGILLSVRTGWIQIRYFPKAIRAFFSSVGQSNNEGGTSPYRALCTALAATVGTGNLAGVAGAIALGGPGAIFWMWICAILGMATKFAEATLSVRYQLQEKDGSYVGGPMYIVRGAMGSRWQFLAGIYCFFGVVAAFGVGSATQINAALGGINSAVVALGGKESCVVNLLIGLGLAAIVMLVLFGGAKRIGTAASFLVPFASVFYLVLCVGVLAAKASLIPAAFTAIFKGAFCPHAVTGGVLGSAFQALRIGASRGVFTNESGMGTAGMAHGAARVAHPVQQGMMGIIEVFLDTIVICTMTALVILCSGISLPYGKDLGVQITTDAFSYVYGNWITIPLAIALSCFAIATILGWGLYGARCAQFLFGQNVWKPFAILQCISIVLGAILNTGTVWSLSETANGLMAIPNLIILIYLSPEVARMVKDYKCVSRLADLGGTNENIHKSKSMQSFPNAEIPSVCGRCPEAGKENLSSEYRSA